MLEIKINNERLDLPEKVSLDIEDTNPIFNERGSQSLPLTVPPTARNRRLLSFPDLLHNTVAPNSPMKSATVVCKSYQRQGAVNITSAARSQGVTFNIGFDNSTAYEKWQNKKLADLADLPVVVKPVPELLEWLTSRGRNCQPQDEGLAVFEVVLSKAESPNSSDDTQFYVYETLNYSLALRNKDGSLKFSQLIDKTLTSIVAPAGYGVSPFLKVWRLLELAFADLGVTITENPIKDDPDLNRLVILNNTMDGVATGRLDYAELMPDCTVAELMNALWVRFGLTYIVNSETRTVRLRFIKDIINDRSSHDFDDEITALEAITYESPKYVKLSAGTSFEGAEPPSERFEDFIGRANRPKYVGAQVAKWLQGDAKIRLIPWDSRATEALGCEINTGRWYRLDTENLKAKSAGSSFFNWDPQPDDCEALELSSVDECVPVEYVDSESKDPAMTWYPAENLLPMYLCGCRHRHSALKGADSDDDDEKNETPLAFMFAYLRNRKGVGRIAPEIGGVDDGDEDFDLEGERPRLSLYFQFKDGLFANFWREYDEMVRHSNRFVEVPARLSFTSLRGIDMLEPVRLRSVRCLIDSFKYSLPADKTAAVDIKLRAIQPQGAYDIIAEQSAAPINWSAGRLEWKLINTNIDEVRASISNADVIKKFKEKTGYRDYYDDNNVYHYLSAEHSVYFKQVGGETAWADNPPSVSPTDNLKVIGKGFAVSIIFEIYEVIETSSSTHELQPAPNGSDFSYTPSLPFTARYAPIWISA